jgi:hypothetical protein
VYGQVVQRLVFLVVQLAQNNPDLDYYTLIQNTLEQMLKPCLFTTLTTHQGNNRQTKNN